MPRGILDAETHRHWWPIVEDDNTFASAYVAGTRLVHKDEERLSLLDWALYARVSRSFLPCLNCSIFFITTLLKPIALSFFTIPDPRIDSQRTRHYTILDLHQEFYTIPIRVSSCLDIS